MSVNTAATPNSETPQAPSLRQHWMSVLAMASTEQLLSRSSTIVANHQFSDIRTAEVGLAQVRGRMGGIGNAFNLGDMTLTRCVVRSEEGRYGYSFVSGRDRQHARRAAELDALLQSEAHQTQLIAELIEPLQQIQAEQDRKRREKTESTRVNFFTLVRGED